MAARVPTPSLSRPSGYEEKKAVNLPKPFKIRRFYTPSEVSRHNSYSDCWVSFFYNVYDLTKLLADNRDKQSALCVPIATASGTDITHWFDPLTQEVSRRVRSRISENQPCNIPEQFQLTIYFTFSFHSLSEQSTQKQTWFGGIVQWAATFTSHP